MAATVAISESNDTTPTVTTPITRSDWLSADSVGTSDKRATYPITLPGAGYTYSYEKWHRLYVSAMGGSSTIDGIRHYLYGSVTSGWEIQTSAATSPTSNKTYDTTNGPETSAFTECPNAMPTVDPATATIYGSLTAAGYSGYVVCQARVGTSATAGQGLIGLVYKYNESA